MATHAQAPREIQATAALPSRDRTEWLGFWPLVGAVALTGLSLLLRLHAVGQESLWEDEGYTLLFSGLPIDRVITVAGHHEHPPLYYLLVHAMLAVKNSYLDGRVLSAVAGALGTPLVARIGTRLFSPIAGLVAALLYTVSPFLLWHAQNGRGYVLACLFVLLSYALLIEAVEQGTARWWVLYALAGLLAIYTEYTTLLALLPQGIVLLDHRVRSRPRHPLLAWGLMVLGYLPWVGIVLDNTRRVVGENYWIPPPTLHTLSSTALKFVGLMTDVPTMKPLTPYEVPLPLLRGQEAVVLALVVVGVVLELIYALRTRSIPLLLVGLWLATPFAFILLMSPIQSLYIDRIFVGAAPALYLLVGWFVWMALGRHSLLPLAATLISVMLLGSLLGVAHIYASSDNPDWKTPMRDLRSLYKPGQAVVLYPGVLHSILPRYLPRNWHPTRELTLWTETYYDVSGLSPRFATIGDDRLRNDLLGRSVAGTHQVWLLCDDYVGLWEVRLWFAQHGYHLQLRRSYHGWSDIELWAK